MIICNLVKKVEIEIGFWFEQENKEDSIEKQRMAKWVLKNEK